MRILFYISIMLAFVSALALLINPVTGILLITLFKPVIDTSFYVPLGSFLTLTKIYGVIIPSIIILYIITARGKNSLRYMPLRALWVIYAVDVFIFSIIIVYNRGILAGLDVFFRHINGFIGFYMFQAFFRLDEKMKLLFTAMILAGIFPVLTTLYQIITGVQWHALAHSVTEGGAVRSPGLYFHIVTVRYYCYQALIGMLLYWSLVSKPGIAGKIVGLTLISSILVITFHTYSKAGYVEIALWAIIWTVLRKKYVIFATILLAGIIVIPFYASDIANDILTVFHKEIAAVSGDRLGEAALAGRIYGWKGLMETWSELNLFLQLFGSGTVMTGAHNDYIMMLFHGGVLGLIIYLVLFGTIGFRIVSELIRKVDPLGIAAFLLYVTFLIETVGLEPSSYPHFQWLVWGIAGLFLRRRYDERAQPDESHIPPKSVRDPDETRILSRAEARQV